MQSRFQDVSLVRLGREIRISRNLMQSYSRNFPRPEPVAQVESKDELREFSAKPVFMWEVMAASKGHWPWSLAMDTSHGRAHNSPHMPFSSYIVFDFESLARTAFVSCCPISCSSSSSLAVAVSVTSLDDSPATYIKHPSHMHQSTYAHFTHRILLHSGADECT